MSSYSYGQNVCPCQTQIETLIIFNVPVLEGEALGKKSCFDEVTRVPFPSLTRFLSLEAKETTEYTHSFPLCHVIVSSLGL